MPPAPRTLNIGILAHVDAGKTSLTERLLFDTGTIRRLGSVDDGSTQTDTGAIERQRGITVHSAVAAFRVGDTQVNLIDTPGHSDFVAEVERALGVLDAAVLVLSAVEGVQAQTRVLMRTLREARLPTLVFANKIDRAGARTDALIAEIRRKLTPHAASMTHVRDAGTRAATTEPRTFTDPRFRSALGELLAEHDDTLLARVVDGPEPTPADLSGALADQTAKALVHPVYFGSAIGGQGVDALIAAIVAMAPEPAQNPAPDPAAPPRGTVFAVERDPSSGHKTAYLRLFEGEVTNRQWLTFASPGTRTTHTGRLTALDVVGAGTDDSRTSLAPGNIGKLRGLPDIRVGDHLGRPPARTPRFAAPTLQSVVRPREPGTTQAARLHRALTDLAEQDPLIRARTEPGGAISVLLYGEVQKEVIAATLADAYGIAAVFEPSRTVCTERLTGTGEAVVGMDRGPAPTGHWATVGLRVTPAPYGSGTAFRYETELGALPRAFHQAIEETVHEALRAGCGPHGWAVTDCAVTLVRSGFNSIFSTAGDFRALTRIVLGRAVREAGTTVHEPYRAFELEVPPDTLATVAARLTAMGALIEESRAAGEAWLLRGTVAARLVAAIEQRLPGLTHGEGVWWSRPADERPVTVREPVDAPASDTAPGTAPGKPNDGLA
ncbi:GTP-binding protein [Streptomyces sp. NPDC059095]|uniref:GTP-binding protein n=1 Tax=Streptomyces sp. NPDC059095 TaxID=3346726 RepID=UPI0036976C6B